MDPKPWFLSKTVIGGIVAIAAGLARAAGMEVDDASLGGVLEGAAAIVGGALSIYGRIKAERPIRWG